MGPTWDPPGSCRPQMGPMLAPWTLLSGTSFRLVCAQNNVTIQIWMVNKNIHPMHQSLSSVIILVSQIHTSFIATIRKLSRQLIGQPTVPLVFKKEMIPLNSPKFIRRPWNWSVWHHISHPYRAVRAFMSSYLTVYSHVPFTRRNIDKNPL